MQLTIRPAQQKDKESILEFCQNTFTWGDYIPNVWDTWIKEEHAQLFTALIDDKPVGIMRVSILKLGEAWLQAARTHPDYRRRGIATALANTCLHWAKIKGAYIARLSTDSDNTPAQKTLQKQGFIQVSDFLIMECKRLRSKKAVDSRWTQKTDNAGIWAYLKDSEIFKASGSLYTVLFTWMSLDEQDLTNFIKRRQAIIHESKRVIDGLVLVDQRVRDVWQEKAFQTCYIDGNHETIVDMMKLFKTYSQQEGVENIYAFACNYPTIAQALAEAGFSHEEPRTELIFERKL